MSSQAPHPGIPGTDYQFKFSNDEFLNVNDVIHDVASGTSGDAVLTTRSGVRYRVRPVYHWVKISPSKGA